MSLRNKLRKWLGVEALESGVNDLAETTKSRAETDYSTLVEKIKLLRSAVDKIPAFDECRRMLDSLCEKCDEIKSTERGLAALRRRNAPKKKPAKKKPTRKR